MVLTEMPELFYQQSVKMFPDYDHKSLETELDVCDLTYT